MASLERILLEYETKLMDPELCRSQKAAEFLADDFIELAGNGRILNKSEALVMMRGHNVRTLAIEQFHLRELSPDVVLVTYRVRSHGFGGAPNRASMCSSIWVQRNHQWQITFHQTTLITSTPEPM